MYMFEENSSQFKDSGYLLWDSEYCNSSFHAFYYCIFNKAINYLIKYSTACLKVKIDDQKALLKEYKKRRDLTTDYSPKTSYGYHQWVISETIKNFKGFASEKTYFTECFLMIKDLRTQADYNHILITKENLHLVNPKIIKNSFYFSSFEYLENQLNKMLLNE